MARPLGAASRPSFLRAALESRRRADQLRGLTAITPLTGTLVEMAGQALVNFSSNDYLGLARHPALIEGAARYLRRYGVGATASRLVCGNLDCLPELEARLARLKGAEAALILNSGYQANVALIPALVNRRSLVLADRLCHNSLIQGIILSRAKLVRFRHNDLAHLEELLTRHGQESERMLVVSESVFSMDGDRADLDALIAVSRRHRALLMIDEAHATGVLGPGGMGLGCGKDIDVLMGTFGKGLGSYGAYVSCSAELREYLINFCSGLIYSTALPPPVLGAIEAALALAPEMDRERAHLHRLADGLRQGLRALGLSPGDSTTQIVPVILGDARRALAMSRWLSRHGFLATAIRPPTVEPGRARLRLALSALHTQEQVDRLLAAISSFANG
ncbi:MAG: 8-amino-7-oxononanoate synthase [Desulfobacteraceae bacterium]|nr:8-amino-7-oxononanoate synthase [Desulfobacteraceae bacterium]